MKISSCLKMLSDVSVDVRYFSIVREGCSAAVPPSDLARAGRPRHSQRDAGVTFKQKGGTRKLRPWLNSNEKI